jgi:hypothetical protein
VPQPRHGFDDQHRRVHRFDETFVCARLIGFHNIVHGVRRHSHQDGTATRGAQAFEQRSAFGLGKFYIHHHQGWTDQPRALNGIRYIGFSQHNAISLIEKGIPLHNMVRVIRDDQDGVERDRIGLRFPGNHKDFLSVLVNLT